LGEARIGIDDDAVGMIEAGPGGEAFVEGAGARVGEGEELDAGIGGEEFGGFGAAGEEDFGTGEAALGGIEKYAGDGDVRA
jgi:hypothetical protein